MSQSVEDRSRVWAIAILVVAILAGLWSAIGAFYPGTFVGAVAAVMALVVRQRAPEANRALPTVSLFVALLVIAEGMVFLVIDA
jgi:branched-subunit amino acid ABC-type transport system permease component